MPKQEADFLTHLGETLVRVRSSWTSVLGELNLHEAKAFHISKTLEATSTLTWQLLKMVRSESTVEGAKYLPGKAGCRSLLVACEKAGASQEGLESVRKALSDYRSMVSHHAGSRQTLHSMLLAQEVGNDETKQIQLRKMGFQANSSNLGVRAKTRIGTTFVTPSDKPGFLNTASAGGILQFQRLVPNVRWPVLYLRGRLYTQDSDDTSPESQQAMPSLLKEFSTVAPTDLVAESEDDGTSYWLTNERVGLSAAVDCMFEWRDKLMPCDQGMAHGVDMKTPVECLVFTVLYHRSIEIDGDPFFYLYSRMQGPLKVPCHTAFDYHMPVPMDFVPFEDASRELDSPHIPFDQDLIQMACAKRGYEARDFRGWRLTLRYPPIPTLPSVFLRVK